MYCPTVILFERSQNLYKFSNLHGFLEYSIIIMGFPTGLSALNEKKSKILKEKFRGNTTSRIDNIIKNFAISSRMYPKIIFFGQLS